MRISVITPSRGRVVGLATMLRSLHALESGKHKVTYAAALDDDDKASIAFCQSFGQTMPLAYAVYKGRPESLGKLVNDTALDVPADVYCALSDDAMCLTKDWDDIIAQAVEQTPHGVFWWKDVGPADGAYAIVTEKWRKAMGGVFSTHFPYWFDDLWLAEVWTMATGSGPIIPEGLKLVDIPRSTMRMRDLPWWTDFYFKTRGLRASESRRIAQALGLCAPVALDELLKVLDVTFTRAADDKLLALQANQGEANSAPDLAYLRAKTRAHELLKTLGGHSGI